MYTTKLHSQVNLSAENNESTCTVSSMAIVIMVVNGTGSGARLSTFESHIY